MDAPSTPEDAGRPGNQLADAAGATAQVIERVLPPGDLISVSSGATYRIARVTWETTAWYGADDIVTFESASSTTVLVRTSGGASGNAVALHDVRFAAHPDSEARDTWLAGDAMRDVDTGDSIYLAGHAALIAFAREREELLDHITELNLSDETAIRMLRGEFPVDQPELPGAEPDDDLPF